MIATYRLQLQPDFGFAEVEALIPYFEQLGISHLYLSPITEAQAGSLHGYDVVDHNAVREEFGGRAGFDRLLKATRAAGLELILDFVPNHAGVGPHNAYWQEVLAYGPHAPHAATFDIDWDPLEETLQDKILLPFLGTSYGEALDEGQIRLVYNNGRFCAAYYEDRFALSPATYAVILEAALPRYERTDLYFDLKDLLRDYATLTPAEVPRAELLARRLVALSEHIDWAETLADFEHARLHALLERQFWRLAYWKTASYEINYRRFFNINTLVGLRMEDEAVFWNAHRLLGDLLAQEGVAGVRIDHIDGLFDPHHYLDHLRSLGARHIWVEKILAPGEMLPEAWPVDGTTGYQFMNDVMHLLLDPDGMPALHRLYKRFVPEATSFDEEVRRSKLLVIEKTLSSDLYRLAHELNRLSKADYHTRDFSLGALRVALAEVVAAFGRYRTYLPYANGETRDVIQQALYRARQHPPAFDASIYDFIGQVILGEVRSDLQDQQRAWTGRFQQYTAPVAAKGVEDTAFYRYLPFVALNEVGGEPEVTEHPMQVFHSHARFRAQRYPRTLLATATHDHKRGADLRMRLLALSQEPALWEETVWGLSEIGETHRSLHGPSRYDEYLFYQMLAALWSPGDDQPDLEQRLTAYMQKASRESKRRTSWGDPDAAYEQALDAFVQGLLGDARLPAVLDACSRTLAERGFFNTISQVVLKFTTPGVPDLYQGRELLDLSLVDPDNRSPVDYARRQALLREMQGLLDTPDADRIAALFADREETAKFYLTARLLHLRRSHPALFAEGTYRPLQTGDEEAAPRWIVFARQHEDEALVVVVPRRAGPVTDPRSVTLALPDDLTCTTWTDVLTGTGLSACQHLDTAALPLPWAVLQRQHQQQANTGQAAVSHTRSVD